MNNNPALYNLVEFEKNIRDIQLKSNSIIEVDFVENYDYSVVTENYITSHPQKMLKNISKNLVQIKVDGKIFVRKMDRVLIHQLGDRIWTNANSFTEVLLEWLLQMHQSITLLKDKIKEVLSNRNLVIRYLPGKSNLIYGIVSSLYSPTNQLKFRDDFIKYANESGCFDINQSFIKPRKLFETVEESFSFNTASNSMIALNCALIYGLNNGYGAYKIKWHRKSRKDNAWFTPFEAEDGYEWRNNSFSEIENFVHYIIKEGKNYQDFIDTKVSLASNTSLAEAFMEEFLNKMLIAYATKDRIRNNYEIATREYGRTVWAVSSSLRITGSFDPHTPKNTKWLLLDTGTLMIDKKYEEYLYNIKEIKLTGNYQVSAMY